VALDIPAVLLKKKQSILETWINNQLANDSLRDDLISNDDARMQSEELLDAFLNNLRLESRGASSESDQDAALEIIETIAITRARKGYSQGNGGFPF
jgi:rsbT co-antagonist protein RsbR